jgi:hypothetical protein
VGSEMCIRDRPMSEFTQSNGQSREIYTIISKDSSKLLISTLILPITSVLFSVLVVLIKSLNEPLKGLILFPTVLISGTPCAPLPNSFGSILPLILVTY